MKPRNVSASLLLGALALSVGLFFAANQGDEPASIPEQTADRGGSSTALVPEVSASRRSPLRAVSSGGARTAEDPEAGDVNPASAAQPFDLRVVEAGSGQPIPGAAIARFNSAELLGRTDAAGFARNLRAGPETWLLVSADGFESRRVMPPMQTFPGARDPGDGDPGPEHNGVQSPLAQSPRTQSAPAQDTGDRADRVASSGFSSRLERGHRVEGRPFEGSGKDAEPEATGSSDGPPRAVVTVELSAGFGLDVVVRTADGGPAPDGSIVILWEGSRPLNTNNMVLLTGAHDGASPLRVERTANSGTVRFEGLRLGGRGLEGRGSEGLGSEGLGSRSDYRLKAIAPGEVQIGFHVVDTGEQAGRPVELSTSPLLTLAVAPPADPAEIAPIGGPAIRPLIVPKTSNGLSFLSLPGHEDFFHQSPALAELAVELLESELVRELLDQAAFAFYRHGRTPDPSMEVRLFHEGAPVSSSFELTPIRELEALIPFEDVMGDARWYRQPITIRGPAGTRLANYGGFTLDGFGPRGNVTWELASLPFDRSVDLLTPAGTTSIQAVAEALDFAPLQSFEGRALDPANTLVLENFALLALRFPTHDFDHMVSGNFRLRWFHRTPTGELVTTTALDVHPEPSPTHGYVALPPRSDLQLLPPESTVIVELDHYRDSSPDLPLEVALTPPLALEVGRPLLLTIEGVD